jgi:hypothetical protein
MRKTKFQVVCEKESISTINKNIFYIKLECFCHVECLILLKYKRLGMMSLFVAQFVFEVDNH